MKFKTFLESTKYEGKSIEDLEKMLESLEKDTPEYNAIMMAITRLKSGTKTPGNQDTTSADVMSSSGTAPAANMVGDVGGASMGPGQGSEI